MRIAVWHNLPSGGGKRSLFYHARGLAERGHTIETWSPQSADDTYLPLTEFAKEHKIPLDWEMSQVTSAYKKFIRSRRYVPSKLIAMRKHCMRCAEEINRGGFDLLYAQPCWYMACTHIAQYVKMPKIIYLQEPYRMLYEMPKLPWVGNPPFSSKPFTPGRLKERLARCIADVSVYDFRDQVREEIENAKAFDKILVNSYFSRESIVRAYGINSKVCYLGIDTDLFVNKSFSREPFAVGLGSFSGSKNVKFIVEAFATIPEPRPKLVWVGNFTTFGYLEEVKELALKLKVDFEPRFRVTDEELIEIMNRASVMVYAPKLEPFGFAPLEASSCGLPVVAVAEGGVRETIIDGMNGLVVPLNANAFGAAVAKLIADPALARKLGENGSKICKEKWNLEASLDRLEESFEETFAELNLSYPPKFIT